MTTDDAITRMFFNNEKCMAARSCQRIACMCAHEKLASENGALRERVKRLEKALKSLIVFTDFEETEADQLTGGDDVRRTVIEARRELDGEGSGDD